MLVKEFMFKHYTKGKDEVIKRAFEQYSVPIKTLEDLWSEVIVKTGVKPKDEKKEATTYKGRKRQFFKFRDEQISINYKKGEPNEL